MLRLVEERHAHRLEVIHIVHAGRLSALWSEHTAQALRSHLAGLLHGKIMAQGAGLLDLRVARLEREPRHRDVPLLAMAFLAFVLWTLPSIGSLAGPL